MFSGLEYSPNIAGLASTINQSLQLGENVVVKTLSDVSKLQFAGLDLHELIANFVRPFVDSNVTVHKIVNIVFLSKCFGDVSKFKR